ncbi:DUF4870 domain-containing protein [Paenibacillus taiwanensis]|uniref:DUF4870 domain-containing protein n=1 Tax=Paenibacillus taiwanensis TaxID=401638 RepID=UPI000415FCB2|nr:DUF4870 domain-containing protein [Paenibacillus taiwanensis]
METRNLLASLSYFSIFFAGFLCPLILLIVTNDPYVKRHASRALLSHIAPVGCVVLAILSFFTGQFHFSLFFILFMLLLSLILFIWNIVMGIKVLQDTYYRL